KSTAAASGCREWRGLYRGCGRHAGQRFHTREQAAVIPLEGSIGWVVRRREGDSKGKQMFGLKAGVGLGEVAETAHEEPRADEHGDSHGDLEHHEDALPATLRGRHAAGADIPMRTAL